MPKIFRLINRFNLGGPSYNAAYLSRYLGPEFDTLLAGGVPLPDEAHSGFIMNREGVKFHEITHMERSVNPLTDWKSYREIEGMIANFQPDIVHTHAAKAGILGRIAAWRNKVPIIVHTFHGHVFSSYFGNFKSSLVKNTERFLASKSDAIIAISAEQQSDLVEKYKICPASKVHVIPLGLDLSRFSSDMDQKRIMFRNKYHLRDDEFCIGIIGRFAPVKNHTLFFEAIRDLKYLYGKKFKAIVIGDGDMKTGFQNLVSEYQLQEEVVFTSWINEVDQALAGLDLVVLTSLNEGTPVSLIEAQAASRPVISTNVGGVKDCMIDGNTGVLVSDFNSSEIAAAISGLMEQPEKCIQFGEAGHTFVNHTFSYTRLVKDMRELYHELMLRKHIPFDRGSV